MTPPLLGAVEAGGTKINCAIGQRGAAPLLSQQFPTTAPDETLGRITQFFREAQATHGPVAAFGVASFGPIELDHRSPQWGRLLATPKVGWAGADMAGPLLREFGRPVAVDTDVNAAALAESRHAPDGPLDSLTYITVGTGIGGGAVIGGRPFRGLLHSEMGHIAVSRAPTDHAFTGVCPFHGDCIEGLASGPAVVRRWGAKLAELPDDHEAWPLLGDYLGQLAAAIALMLSSERIVMGGGVMSDGRLLPHVRIAAARRLNAYLRPERLGDLSSYIVAPALGEHSGIAGAFELAADIAASPSAN